MNTTTINRISQHGDRMADVSHSHGWTRVALDWEHFDGADINGDGMEYIESRVKSETAADEIEWSLRK